MVTINLIPESTLAARAQRVCIKRWAVAISVAAVALFGSAGLDWWARAKAAQLSADSATVAAQLAQERIALREVAAELQQVTEQAERAAALRAKRAWSSVLALIGTAMPPGGWLKEVATDPPRPTGAPRPTPRAKAAAGGASAPKSDVACMTIEAPRRLRVSGYCAHAGDPYILVTNLKQAAVFKRVSLERSQLEPIHDGSYVNFEIICEW